MQCPYCSAQTGQDARFCPQCGHRLVSLQHSTDDSPRSGSGWSTFAMSLAISVGLTLCLTLIFHLPIFILGAVLPLFWIGRRGSQ